MQNISRIGTCRIAQGPDAIALLDQINRENPMPPCGAKVAALVRRQRAKLEPRPAPDVLAPAQGGVTINKMPGGYEARDSGTKIARQGRTELMARARLLAIVARRKVRS